MKPIRILELFGGIGACTQAFKNLGIPTEDADYVEIDKYAVKSFNAINGTNHEPQDICKWDKNIPVDFIMHGSPCQDFSIAGKQAGGDEGSGTRSSLLYETLRIVEKTRPKYVIWENVRNLMSARHRPNWEKYCKRMEELGYRNYAKVLNAKDYGVPQNRERVFTVSIKKDQLIYDDYNQNVRKDQNTIGTLTTNCGATAPRNGWKIIETNPIFEFPEPTPLTKKLKDVLEPEVEEKYYLADDKIKEITLNLEPTQEEPGANKVVRVGGLYDKPGEKHQAGGIYSTQGIAATLDTMGGGNREPIVAIKTANKTGYDLAQDGDGIDLAYPNSTTRRGRVGHGVAKTLATSDNQGCLDGVRIRKLTPKECWRLMGFRDEDYEKAEKVNSNTQLYKQAGNSIVVPVLEAIIKNLNLKESS